MTDDRKVRLVGEVLRVGNGPDVSSFELNIGNRGLVHEVVAYVRDPRAFLRVSHKAEWIRKILSKRLGDPSVQFRVVASYQQDPPAEPPSGVREPRLPPSGDTPGSVSLPEPDVSTNEP